MANIPACPRCSSDKTRLLAESPIAGVWEMYACNRCTYLWRSTETLEGIRTITEEEIDDSLLDFPPAKQGEFFQ